MSSIDSKKPIKKTNVTDERCNCGHLINKSHIIDMDKTSKSGHMGKVYSKCKYCDCKEISV